MIYIDNYRALLKSKYLFAAVAGCCCCHHRHVMVFMMVFMICEARVAIYNWTEYNYCKWPNIKSRI